MNTIYFFAIFAIALPTLSFAKDTSRLRIDSEAISATSVNNEPGRNRLFQDIQLIKKEYEAKLSDYEQELKRYEAQKELMDANVQRRAKELNAQIENYNNSEVVYKEPTRREDSTQMHFEQSIAHHGEYLKVADAARDTNEENLAEHARLQQQIDMSQAKWQDVNEMQQSYAALVEKYNTQIDALAVKE